MKKLLLALFLILFICPEVRAGYVDAINCNDIPSAQRATNATICLQSTTVGGRNAGTEWLWNGTAWVATGGGGVVPSGVVGDVQLNDGSGGLDAQGTFTYNTGTSTLTVPNTTLTGSTTLGGSFHLAGDTSPAQIAVDTNNYAGCAVATNAVCRLTTDAPRNLTGIVAGTDGTILLIHNVGANDLTLVNASGASDAANQFLIGINIVLGANQAVILQYDSTSAKWRAISGVSGATTAGAIAFTPNGSIAANNVQAAIQEVRDEAQPLDADLTAIAALAGTGIATRTAPDTWVQRTITGANGITVTDGDGIKGNPVVSPSATVVLTDRANTYSGGGLQDFSANTVKVPLSAGDPAATTGLFKIDTTANTVKIVVNGVVRTFVLNGDTTALAVALAANGTNSTGAAFARGVDASGNAETGNVALSGAATPTAGTVEFAGQNYVDTRGYNCSTQAGLPYIGYTAAGNFVPIVSFQDGYTTFSDGTNTASPCGADTFKFEAGDNITPTVTTGSPDKVVHKIAVASEARGDILFRDATKWTRLAASTNGFCLKTSGAGADPVWADCATATVNAYWDANGIVQDGTNCTDPTKVTINSGPVTYAFVCADSNSSFFEGKVQLPSTITTATFTLTVSDVDSSSQVFAVNVQAMCRNNDTTIDNTFGTPQSIAITMVTANKLYTGTSAAVTPNGTCSAGATLFWKALVLGTTTNTDDGDARILSMSMAGS